MRYSLSMLNPETGADVGELGVLIDGIKKVSELRGQSKSIAEKRYTDGKAVKVQAIPVRTDGTPSYLGNIQCFTFNTETHLKLPSGIVHVPYLYNVRLSSSMTPKVSLTSSYGLSYLNTHPWDYVMKATAELIAKTVQDRTKFSGVVTQLSHYMLWVTPALIYKEGRNGDWKIASLVSLKKDKR